MADGDGTQPQINKRRLFFYFFNGVENKDSFDAPVFANNFAAAFSGAYVWEPKEVVNILHKTAALYKALKVNGTLADRIKSAFSDKLKTAKVEVFRFNDMNSQNVAITAWAFATLGVVPRPDALDALQTAMVREVSRMNSQDVANTAWAFATLGAIPRPDALDALQTAMVREAPRMNSQEVANTAWAFATLGVMPRLDALDALQTAMVREVSRMNSQGVANTAWAFATLGVMPRPDALDALQTAMVREVSRMNSQDVANTVWAFATLGAMPRPDVMDALQTAMVREAPRMNSQEVANTAWAIAVYAAITEKPSDFIWCIDHMLPRMTQANTAQQKQIVDVCLVFSKEAPYKPPIEYGTVGSSEAKLRSFFNSAGLSVDQTNMHVPKLGHKIDASLRGGKILVEFDGFYHFVRHSDGTHSFNGNTILQSHLITKLTQKTLIRVACIDPNIDPDLAGQRIKSAFAAASDLRGNSFVLANNPNNTGYVVVSNVPGARFRLAV